MTESSDECLAHDDWIGHHSGLDEVIDKELQKVFDRASKSTDVEQLARDWTWRGQGNYVVRVGCCDANYPDFKEVRMVCIRREENDPGENY